MKTTAVIMAGGKGERFWPKSRSSLPKQFLSLTDDGKTMLQHTAHRILALVEYEDLYVVTNRDYVDLVRTQLPNMPNENILAEPKARNTAPCIGFAAAVMERKYGDAVMLALPADHIVRFREMYIETLQQAVDVAKEEDTDNLVTIGITPTYPETGYGYIHFGKAEKGTQKGVYAVRGFVEKPDTGTAKEYLASGEYLWNSGMFAWKLSTILGQYKKLLPEIYSGIMEIGQAYGSPEFEEVLQKIYDSFMPESIDYGILERAGHIYTIPGNFGWDDSGNWLVLERFNKTNESGNTVKGDVITIGAKNSIIIGGKKLIAAVGIEGLVVVDSDDAILVCAKDSVQDVKKVVEHLGICNRGELM